MYFSYDFFSGSTNKNLSKEIYCYTS